MDTSNVIEDAKAKLESLPKGHVAFPILKALLEYAPTEEGQCVIADDIVAVSAHQNGFELLADFYKSNLLLPMKAGGRTPQVSYHPSRDQEIKTEANEIAIDLESAKRDQTKLKNYTLYRDGYRCVATRYWDFVSDLAGKCQPSPGEGSGQTEAAHIIPFSLMSANTTKTVFGKCTILSVIESFTRIGLSELNGDLINSLTNTITLEKAVHGFFGMLEIWFEAVPDRPNTYNLRKAHERVLIHIKDRTEVTFTSPNEALYPLPDPRYLAFHAAVAKVVHMAGIAEHLEHILRERENIRVLSDESAAAYLDGLLRIAQKSVVAY